MALALAGSLAELNATRTSACEVDGAGEVGDLTLTPDDRRCHWVDVLDRILRRMGHRKGDEVGRRVAAAHDRHRWIAPAFTGSTDSVGVTGSGKRTPSL
jgi:hypothetical protein